MRIKMVILGVVACFAANAALAGQSASKEENVGVGSGVVVGAIAGGPLGAIVGAAIGAKLGDVFNKRKEEVVALNGDLAGSRSHVNKLEHDVVALKRNVDSLGGDLAQLRTDARPELLSLMQAGIEMDLLFKTDEHVLIEATGDRLNALAASLAAMKDVYIQLDGYADERGDAAYNHELSVRRVEYVRDLLIANGVSANRIQINAHGETPSKDSNTDSYALERKVNLMLFIDESMSFAANPVGQ